MRKFVKPTEKEVLEFLRESNAIEGVYDEDSFNQAKEAWDFLLSCPKLTVDVVKQVHQILMKNQDIPENEKGFFRERPVWIGGREGLSWKQIPAAIDSWLLDAETSIELPCKDGFHIRLDHIEFERIHPWIDGNGRTGRMFMNFQRVKVGFPLHIIHEGREQMEYYRWFKE